MYFFFLIWCIILSTWLNNWIFSFGLRSSSLVIISNRQFNWLLYACILYFIGLDLGICYKIYAECDKLISQFTLHNKMSCYNLMGPNLHISLNYHSWLYFSCIKPRRWTSCWFYKSTMDSMGLFVYCNELL